MKSLRLLPLLLSLFPVSFPVVGQEASVTLHSTISGNQEQPKIMYILPWQQPGDPHFEQRFSAGLTGDLFVPMDRADFLRQLNYQAMRDAQGQGATVEGNEIQLNTE